jgi:UDP-2-acetamido-3-amino-2,3-dideoxy-glucuronate N-acetyltransferase
MPKGKTMPKVGKGTIIGANVQFGEEVVVWNYVVIGDNTKIGDGVRIGSFCDIGKDVTFGKKCNIQAHVTISNGCVLGDNVFIAPNSTLLNDKYPVSSLLTPPTLKDNVIVGGGVTVLPNVVLGEGCVVGGGSVVAKNVPAGRVVAGVPAKEVMALEEYRRKRDVFIRKHRKVNP